MEMKKNVSLNHYNKKSRLHFLSFINLKCFSLGSVKALVPRLFNRLIHDLGYRMYFCLAAVTTKERIIYHNEKVIIIKKWEQLFDTGASY